MSSSHWPKDSFFARSSFFLRTACYTALSNIGIGFCQLLFFGGIIYVYTYTPYNSIIYTLVVGSDTPCEGVLQQNSRTNLTKRLKQAKPTRLIQWADCNAEIGVCKAMGQSPNLFGQAYAHSYGISH